VVLASERMDADDGWRLLAPGELLHVDHALGVSSHVIVAQPPAQPLTIDDLGATAKASQAPSS
jgi:hypothetical protein